MKKITKRSQALTGADWKMRLDAPPPPNVPHPLLCFRTKEKDVEIELFL